MSSERESDEEVSEPTQEELACVAGGSATTPEEEPSPTEELLDDTINIFHSEWKNSDLILVVGTTEFHVHRSILSMQSFGV